MKKKEENKATSRYNFKWILMVTFWTFVMALVFSIITEGLAENLDIFFAFMILIITIFIGIFFDIIGIAVTTAEEKPFHSMASNKVEEAQYAIKLVQNAGQVSNFCNDVIGDISGIISGAIGTTIIYRLISLYSIKNGIFLGVIVNSLVASLTVGGKAFGKSIAMENSENIVLKAAIIISFLNNRFNLNLLPNSKKNDK